jgi:hypothetical protein
MFQSGDVEGFEGVGPGTALGRKLESLGVNNRFQVEKRSIK